VKIADNPILTVEQKTLLLAYHQRAFSGGASYVGNLESERAPTTMLQITGICATGYCTKQIDFEMRFGP